MQIFKKIAQIKAPKPQQLLDIALLLSLVPHLFVFDALLILFLLLGLYFIFRKKRSSYDLLVLFLAGFLLIAAAFFEGFNFSDLSKMQFFVSLVSAVLLLGVVLQRYVGVMNIYIRLSPAFFMLLSFFFFDTIAMLFYSFFAFFMLVLLLIWSRMDAPLGDVLRLNALLFLLSLPAVVVLFIAFPRISFEKAEFGFRGGEAVVSQFDGSLQVSDAPFLPQNRVVMELFFQTQLPKDEALYLRSSLLYPKGAFGWAEAKSASKESVSGLDEFVEYDLLLQPHEKTWLYALDIPTLSPPKTQLLHGQTLESKTRIYKPKRYHLRSALRYRLTQESLHQESVVDPASYPKLALAMESLGEQNIDEAQKLNALRDFFLSQQLAYTAKPKKLDAKNPIDSFLFESKNGYCTHFASSFAIAARLLGIPSRLVSGYKASRTNSVENYLVVKHQDAHVWVELYLEKSGWVRFEPTSFAITNLDESSNAAADKQKNRLFEQLNLQYMYLKFLIDRWILGFDRLKQIDILKNILSDTLYLLKFIAAFAGVVAAVFLFVYLLGEKKRSDASLKSMQKLLKALEKKGLIKAKNESMELFFKRSEAKLGLSMRELLMLYHEARYAGGETKLQKLQEEIEKIRSKLS